uniref:Uncharacterized protein n=1 Tax=Romanomermis culicivorax TaxID=13658 RepID=A0A915KJX7_ROMCU
MDESRKIDDEGGFGDWCGLKRGDAVGIVPFVEECNFGFEFCECRLRLRLDGNTMLQPATDPNIYPKSDTLNEKSQRLSKIYFVKHSTTKVRQFGSSKYLKTKFMKARMLLNQALEDVAFFCTKRSQKKQILKYVKLPVIGFRVS